MARELSCIWLTLQTVSGGTTKGASEGSDGTNEEYAEFYNDRKESATGT